MCARAAAWRTCSACTAFLDDAATLGNANGLLGSPGEGRTEGWKAESLLMPDFLQCTRSSQNLILPVQVGNSVVIDKAESSQPLSQPNGPRTRSETVQLCCVLLHTSPLMDGDATKAAKKCHQTPPDPKGGWVVALGGSSHTLQPGESTGQLHMENTCLSAFNDFLSLATTISHTTTQPASGLLHQPEMVTVMDQTSHTSPRTPPPVFISCT